MAKIELILKSPTDRVAPFSINCDNSWTVKQLKTNIQEIYPCKPKVETQKLIYSGKLLKEDQVLKDIFETDISAIVHFICQPSINLQPEVKQNLDKKDEPKGPDPEMYKEYQEYLRNYYQSSMQNMSGMDQYQHMMWLNQAYMQSYANYYGQWNNRQESNAALSEPCTEVIQRTVTNETPNQENPPNNERRIEPAGDNGMQNMMAAAFGGLMGDGGEDENDGDAEPRDLLHYFYMFVRFGLLLLICYYYSSMVSVVTTLMLFFLFFGVNIFRRNNRVIRPVVIAVPANVPEPVEPLIVNEDTPVTDTPALVIENTHAAEMLPGMGDRLRRAASTSLQFVLTFFITLFPDPVANIDVN